MKPTWQRLLDSVRERLSSYEAIEQADADSIISVELMIYGSLLMDRTIKIESLWSILAGHNVPILKKNTELPIVYRLRVLLSEYRFENYWIDELANYLHYDKRFRLFDRSEEGTVIQIKPQHMPEREKYYYEVLNKPLIRTEDERSFVGNESFRYTRMVEGIEKEYNGWIPDTLINKRTNILPLFKEKIELSLNIEKDWETIIPEMDKKTGNEKGYRSRAESLNMKSASASKQKIFHYKGNQHVGGGLSAGKSTMMVIETYRIVKQHGGRVGFIEGSVAQVLERVKELRNLGIQAVPIIGKSSRKTHENNTLMSKAKK